MHKLSVEEKNRIADHLSILNEFLQTRQIDIYEFSRRLHKMLQFVNAIIEKRETALDRFSGYKSGYPLIAKVVYWWTHSSSSAPNPASRTSCGG